jgi:hypothetical protein
MPTDKSMEGSATRLLLYAATVLALVLTFRSHAVFAQSPMKLWSIDLATDKDFHKRTGVPEVSLNPPSVNFLNEAQILCDFYDEEKIGFNPSLTPRGYHVLEINAQSGAFGRKLDFQSLDDRSRALPVADGGFVVLAGAELKKFSSTFIPGPSYPTPIESLNHQPDIWLIDVAPSGRSLLLYHRRASENEGTGTRIRTTDLTTINSSQVPFSRVIRASDDAGIFGTIDSELISAKETRVLCNQCNAYFLTDNLVFLGGERTYSIEAIAGGKRASGSLNLEAMDFNRSAQTTRFAYSTGHYIGSGFPIQTKVDTITGKIMVLDWGNNKTIAEIDINEPAGNPSDGLNQSALAISPHGKYLAVLLHHTLSLYRRP